MNKLIRKTVITIEDCVDVDASDNVIKRENTAVDNKDLWTFDITYVLNNDIHYTNPDKIMVDKGTPKFMVEEILHDRSKENYRKTGYVCYMENLRKAN
jgi:ABC-type uncharacterized transport system ATPase component